MTLENVLLWNYQKIDSGKLLTLEKLVMQKFPSY